MKNNKGLFNLTGKVSSISRNAYFVKVDNIDKEILCVLSGKMMKNKIKPVIQDWVEIEIHESDMTRGRIIRRN